MSLNLILWLLSAVGEAVVIGLLLYRKVWKTLPWFLVFCIWALVSDVGLYAVMHFSPHAYLTSYFIDIALQSVLEFCVLVDVAWGIFRPYRGSLPRATPYVLGGLIAVAGIAIWPFADFSAFANFSLEWQRLGRLLQTVSILRILFFLILAGCSHLLSIGWRDRELQVATGLGFYSLVSLTVSLFHTHQTTGPQFNRLEQLLVVSYVCCLGYWVISFAQKEVERREFSPQMQGILLAVAGAARTTRVAMTDRPGKPGTGERP